MGISKTNKKKKSYCIISITIQLNLTYFHKEKHIVIPSP